MSYAERTTDAERLLRQRLHRHYALRVGTSWHIYMEVPGRPDKHIATRTSTAGALGIIRHRRDAAAETEQIVRRECESTIRRMLDAGQADLQPTGS